MNPTTTAGPGAPHKPAGGFCAVPFRELAALWWAYRRDHIRFLDLRVALAAREMLARRCLLAPGRAPCFALGELAALTGATPRNLRASLRRLAGLGMLRWAEDAVEFAEGTASSQDPEYQAWVEGIPNHRRRVPVPRRMLRLLARGARPVRLAAVLGCLFRCAYQRGRALALRGRVKASWIAETFGVDLRRVKDARSELVRSGWLVPEGGDDQRAMNRWGRAYRVDPGWCDPETRGGLRLPPPPIDPGPGMPPPITDGEPLPRSGNQEPVAGGDAGVRNSQGEEKRLPPPDLRRVRPEDLGDTARTLELHRQAAGQGLVSGSESDRLKVLAAAEHARAAGRRNPPGLFVALLRRGLWSHLTSGDDEAAARRLKRHLHGPRSRSAAPPDPEPPEPSPSSSDDARLVQTLRRRLGGRGDPYLALRRSSPEWTRARYDRAVAELETRMPSASPGPAAPTCVGSSLGSVLAGLGRPWIVPPGSPSGHGPSVRPPPEVPVRLRAGDRSTPGDPPSSCVTGRIGLPSRARGVEASSSSCPFGEVEDRRSPGT